MVSVVLPAEIAEIANSVSAIKRNEVAEVLNDIFSKTAEWENQVDSIQIADINDKVNIKMADIARKNAKDFRVASEKIFDAKRAEVQQLMIEQKTEDSLWLKAKQVMQIKLKAIEDKAAYKAKFEERYHAEQKELRTQMRLAKCKIFSDAVIDSDVSELSDNVFEMYLNGLEVQYKEKIKQEQEAELERLRIEKINQLNNVRKNEILEIYEYVANEYKFCDYGELESDTWEKIKSDAINAKEDNLRKQQQLKTELRIEKVKAITSEFEIIQFAHLDDLEFDSYIKTIKEIEQKKKRRNN
ncbi:MAG: hypothetical protein HC892_09980 [Saprospiraceae bacterium]|nr:hypothetical protein [Saprospiraceae bacterium]